MLISVKILNNFDNLPIPINAESFENLILPLTSIQKIQLYQTLDDPNYNETILEWQG